jgi:chemotaxis signal transduction protein
MATDTPAQELRRRLRDLEHQLAGVRQELAKVSPGEKMSGLQTLIDTDGARCVLSAAGILEIGPLVHFTKVPSAPPHVLGTLIGRGIPTLAVHLGSLLAQVKSEPGWYSKLVILHGSRRIALVVDRITALTQAPLLSAEGDLSAAAERLRRAELVAGYCRVEQEVLPILQVEPIIAALEPFIP